MDEAPLRRGQPTVHEKWNTNTAILSGDAMLVKVYDFILEAGGSHLKELLQLFNKCAVNVCEGQQLDMEFESRKEVTDQEYINMIRLKTAVLLGFCLQSGSIIGEANQEQSQLMCEVGVNAGIGFQLQDDWLDAFGETAKVGKQTGGDIISNKKTFLLIKAREAAKGKPEEKILNKWLTATQFDKTEKVAAVKAIYQKLGVEKEAQQAMKRYFDKSFEAIASLNLTQDKEAALKQLIAKLIYREQ